jgi:ferredoxin
MNCPFCKRLLYSRQHKKCGHCGEELPEKFRLTEEEIEAIKDENRAIEERRAIAKEKEEAEREEKRRKARRRRSGPGFFQ